ncbi:MAG: pcaH [Microbacterium sp.]|jgi:protocatechuate 3,4-dioxygenase beta subunit|nr:pcaH [Microbacterium sp.]
MTAAEPDRPRDENKKSAVAAPESLLASPDMPSQRDINAEIAEIHADAAAREARGESVPTTLYDFPPYRSSVLRHPTKNPRLVDPETIELYSPAYGQRDVAAIEADLTLQHSGEPLGERITVTGRVLDAWGRPVRNQLIEVWQANAAGRYIHQRDQHPAPLDPNFTGAGRMVTNDDGEYFFTTIKPGPYPWKNHINAWRPAHIHFSLFGTGFTQRIITQMYFPSDPLFALDPIYNTIRDQKDRDRLISTYDHDLTVPEFSMGYRWDIVVDGPDATWFEPEGEH